MGVPKYWNQFTRSGRLRISSTTLPTMPTTAVQSATNRHFVMFQICGYSELCTCVRHALMSWTARIETHDAYDVSFHKCMY